LRLIKASKRRLSSLKKPPRLRCLATSKPTGGVWTNKEGTLPLSARGLAENGKVEERRLVNWGIVALGKTLLLKSRSDQDRRKRNGGESGLKKRGKVKVDWREDHPTEERVLLYTTSKKSLCVKGVHRF